MGNAYYDDNNDGFDDATGLPPNDPAFRDWFGGSGDSTTPNAAPIVTPKPADTVAMQYGTSSSYGGLPGWATDYIKILTGTHGATAMDDYVNAVKGVKNNPKLIEQQRVLQNKQFNRDIQAPMYNSMKTGVNSLVGRGMLNSSVSGDWISRLAENASETARKQQTDSNVWASNALMANNKDNVTASAGLSGILGEYLKAAEYSKAQSSTPVFAPGQVL